MSSKKLVRTYLIILALYLPFLMWYLFSAINPVFVMVTPITVTINGVTLESNEYARYPILKYKDNLYFPMTYNQSTILNLNVEWTKSKGLTINRGNPAEPKGFMYEKPKRFKNASLQLARAARGAVKVNGKELDYSTDASQLLSFRDIVYFPIDSKEMAEEFGWTCNFGNDDTLTIYADNFFYTLPNGGKHKNTFPTFTLAETHYVRGDKEVHMSIKWNLPMGPTPFNLIIKSGNNSFTPSGCFGYNQDSNILFGVEDNAIVTDYLIGRGIYDEFQYGICKIDMLTGEVFPLDSDFSEQSPL